MVPSLHLNYDTLSLTSSAKVQVDEEVTRRHLVYLYRCSGGQLQEIAVCLGRYVGNRGMWGTWGINSWVCGV